MRNKVSHGLWIGENEGAKFWASALNENLNRGTRDILIARMDWLSGFPDAARAVFPETRIQKGIAHRAHNSTKFISYKDLKAVYADLKAIYPAPSEESGRAALEEFGEKRRAAYPLIYKFWDSTWPDLGEFFKYPEEIRRVIYRTNAIESLNCQLRKVTRNRSVLARDEAIYKIMYLALRNAAKKWTMPIKDGGGGGRSQPVCVVFWRAGSALMNFIYTKLLTVPIFHSAP